MRMKHLIRSIALVAATTSAAFSQAPKDVQDFTSHGIHVILRSTNANEVVSAVAGFEGGLAYGETSNATVATGTAGTRVINPFVRCGCADAAMRPILNLPTGTARCPPSMCV